METGATANRFAARLRVDVFESVAFGELTTSYRERLCLQGEPKLDLMDLNDKEDTKVGG